MPKTQHPTKMVEETFVLCVYHFWVGFIEILIILDCFWPFFLEHKNKTKSMILQMKMRSNQKVEEYKPALKFNLTYGFTYDFAKLAFSPSPMSLTSLNTLKANTEHPWQAF